MSATKFVMPTHEMQPIHHDCELVGYHCTGAGIHRLHRELRREVRS